MIEAIFKFLILGPKNIREDFFALAQQEALAEFIDLSCCTKIAVPQKIEQLVQALGALKKLPQPVQCSTELYLPIEIAEKVDKIDRQITEYEEALRVTESEIVKIEPFGEFSLEEVLRVESLSHTKAHYFCVKHDPKKQIDIPENMIHLGTSFDLDYYICFSQEPFSLEGFVEIKITKSLATLKEEKERLQHAIHLLHEELLEIASFTDFLKEALTIEMDRFHLDSAINTTCEEIEGSIFVAVAWIPQSKIKKLDKMVENLPIFVDRVALDEGEIEPTAMYNKGLAEVGQDLVDLYDTPSTQDKDPSIFVLFAFALFFAVIIADAGYGLLYLIAAGLLWWRKPNLKGMKRRMLILFTILATSTTFWGFLTGSFFSIQIEPSHPLNKVSIVHWLSEKKALYHLEQKDEVYKEIVKEYPAALQSKTAGDLFEAGVQTTPEEGKHFAVMEDFHEGVLGELAILIGLLHLIISFARGLYRSIGGIGWIAFLIGGYLFCPSAIHVTSMVNFLQILSSDAARETGLQLMGVGFCFAIISALIMHGFKGLEEIFRSIQIFGDSLSYLRLYALGLASMHLAATFNSIGASIGFVYGAIVIFMGHATNILLGTMAGVIHGLRLNFLEWYHYCFEGGGKPWRPLKLQEREEN